MSNEPSISYDAKGNAVSFNGREAVEVFRCAALMSAIGLLSKGIKPSRGWTMKRALAMASQYSGKHYKRGEHEQAVRDLRVWKETMRSAIPTETME